jgi:hypothetical protein
MNLRFSILEIVRKHQVPNNERLKTAKCGAFCETCEATNRVVEQVHYPPDPQKRQAK